MRDGMDNEYLEVEFTAVESGYNNCTCDACHFVGRVKKLRLPRTKYYTDGKLSTIYTNYWICDECQDDLQSALENAVKE